MAEKEKSESYNEMSLDELIAKKKQVMELLAMLEDEYRNAAITEASYKQAKGSNAKKLELLKKKLEEFGIVDNTPAPSPAPKAEEKKEPASAAAPLPAPSSPAPEEQSADVLNVSNMKASAEGSGPQPASPPLQARSAASKIASAFGIGRPSLSSAEISQAVEPLVRKVDEKFSLEAERMKATMDMMKESRTATDERMQRMTENIAELRSMIFQRETTLRNYDVKIEKISEAMADIDPQKITKEFNKRDKSEAEVQVRLEKLERKTEDMMKSITETNALLKSIGGLENIANVDRDIAKKMAHIEGLTKSVERLSEKTEKMFVEINKNLEDFILYKVRQENIETMVEDLMKTADKTGIKFENYLEKKELAAFRDGLNLLQKQFELLKKGVKKTVPFVEMEIPKDVLELQRQREDIDSLISSVGREYEQKRISEADYRNVIDKNQAKLAEIDSKLKDAIEKMGREAAKQEENIKIKKEEKPRKNSDEKAQSETLVQEPQVSEISAAQESTKNADGSAGQKAVTVPPVPAATAIETKTAAADSAVGKAPPADSGASAAPKTEQTKPSVKPKAEKATKKEDVSKEKPAKSIDEKAQSAALAQESQASSVQENPLPSLDSGTAAKKQDKAPLASSGSSELLRELEDSFRQGLITKDAYEHTKKLLAAL